MKIAQTLSFVLGLVLGIIAIQWLISPENSANSLNMTYLEGLGRNTQIRDFTAMFMGTSVMCFFSTSAMFATTFSANEFVLILPPVNSVSVMTSASIPSRKIFSTSHPCILSSQRNVIFSLQAVHIL